MILKENIYLFSDNAIYSVQMLLMKVLIISGCMDARTLLVISCNMVKGFLLLEDCSIERYVQALSRFSFCYEPQIFQGLNFCVLMKVHAYLLPDQFCNLRGGE